MTVEDGAEFFKAVPSIREKLSTLQQVGLGYIHIGQPATTLSAARLSASSWPRSCHAAPPAARSTSSTSRPRPAFRGRAQACSKCCIRWSSRATPSW
jgi:hypothetical protein